jgi:D-sedoheptulose 7-phosphate isomerase
MKYESRLEENLKASIQAKRQFLEDAVQKENFRIATQVVVDAYRKGGKLLIAGNGGSAADAQHLAAEFVSKLARPRAALPAEALTVDTSTLTAIGNDFSFDEVFSRQLEGKAKPGDVFLGITTSGKSKNIIKALQVCKELKVPSILLTGKDGGDAKKFADYCITVSGTETSTIQELHMVIYHSLCGCVEAELFPV